VDAQQDPGRGSNSSAPDHSGGETSAKSAGGDSFSGGCEREQREAGKRKRCEEQVATEQVRAEVQRYKRMTDRGGGRLGEQLEAQVQERPWRRARKRKRQEVSESETREADAVIQTHRRKKTSRHSERTLSVWQRMLDEGMT
jgi:succinate dehydrogenase/fumarate reductase flavoprotein subunit